MEKLVSMIKQARRVYVIGNGGSYANASHVTNDLLFCGVRAFSVDPATLSCLANDYGWDRAMAMWVGTVGEPGDLLIAMSGSGKSPNILAAVEQAEKMGMMVWREYGAAQGLDMETAEERQVWMGHELKRRLRR
jgi:phosphoheptose isomerase